MIIHIKRIIRNSLRSIESIVWDFCLGIHSAHKGSGEITATGMFGDANKFEAQAHSAIRHIIKQAELSPDDVVFVVGCGKGRALCHFALQHIKRVVGIEISESLARQANTNVKALHGRKAEAQVIHSDACLADYSEGSVFYFYNPFGQASMQNVISKIMEAWRIHHKPVKIIYVNPKFSNVLAGFPEISKTDSYSRGSGVRVEFYSIKAGLKKAIEN
jgi:SAM-dependent methyltransferase